MTPTKAPVRATLAAVTGLLLLLALVTVGGFATASAKPTTPGKPALPFATPHLTVAPSGFDSTALIKVDTLEWTDALPDYSLGLTRISTGARAAVDYGSGDADPNCYEACIEGPYEAYTRGALADGAVYNLRMHVVTVGVWICSQYDPDGCTWYDGETEDYQWRFTYHAHAATSGTSYYPQPVLSLIKKKTGRHAWKVKARAVTTDGQVVAGQRVTLQYLYGGFWVDKRAKTANSSGHVKFKVTPKKAATHRRYRLHTEETTFTRAAASRLFRLKYRR